MAIHFFLETTTTPESWEETTFNILYSMRRHFDCAPIDRGESFFATIYEKRSYTTIEDAELLPLVTWIVSLLEMSWWLRLNQLAVCGRWSLWPQRQIRVGKVLNRKELSSILREKTSAASYWVSDAATKNFPNFVKFFAKPIALKILSMRTLVKESDNLDDAMLTSIGGVAIDSENRIWRYFDTTEVRLPKNWDGAPIFCNSQNTDGDAFAEC